MATSRGKGRRTPAWQQVARCILCTAGLALSAYALYVETAKERNSDYKAMCDVSKTISCSKVFTSKYGRGFGLIEPLFGRDCILNLPNSVFGLIFYVLQFFLGQSSNPTASLVLVIFSLLSNLATVYLAYILYFILNDACLVCISTYVVNAALLILNLRHHSAISQGVIKKKV
ncbi:vitamin K epoxide reductase complex subunit 1-like [Ptychodera flava]|uniref:vitamin K epoxide reductase complex subunit 1-like n=1 Tax=Ptychodera flava TaxID=63121 RepID=UPI003969C366